MSGYNTYRQIDLSLWHQVGEGGNGKTYENPSEPDLILKINNDRLSTLENVLHEYQVSKAVESLGLLTPKMHEMVRVGESYATISGVLKARNPSPGFVMTSPSVLLRWQPFYVITGK